MSTIEVDHYSGSLSDVCFIDARRRGFGKESWVLSFVQVSRIEGCSLRLPGFLA